MYPFLYVKVISVNIQRKKVFFAFHTRNINDNVFEIEVYVCKEQVLGIQIPKILYTYKLLHGVLDLSLIGNLRK